MPAPESLEVFLSAVRSSCDGHASRKGYLGENGKNVLGEITELLGVEQFHAIGEILAKLVEFKAGPRRVLAEKIAGWAWRLWLTVPEEENAKHLQDSRAPIAQRSCRSHYNHDYQAIHLSPCPAGCHDSPGEA